jgi:hypothetical protein
MVIEHRITIGATQRRMVVQTIRNFFLYQAPRLREREKAFSGFLIPQSIFNSWLWFSGI